MEPLPYFQIPVPPEYCTASSILIRIIDGLGFRYRWATEGLTEEDYLYRPSTDSMNMKELFIHIYRLVSMVNNSIGGKKPEILDDDSLENIRKETLKKIFDSRKKLLKMDDSNLKTCQFYSSYYDKNFPIWNILNGPLCDALTHVGQINTWRRLHGNPVFRANVFLGNPP
jgi:hypothetical protein